VSILWFSKIKEILEYKKFSKVSKYDPGDISDTNDQPSEFVANLENSNQILKGMNKPYGKGKRGHRYLICSICYPKERNN
jgi:hypothetical protein